MARLLNWLSQVAAVTRFSLQTIPQRRGSAAAALFGIAGVVAVLVGVLSIAQGIARTMQASAASDGAIVLRSGANTEMMSGLGGDDAKIITEAPGIARNADGAIASPELLVIISLPKRSTDTDANVPLRGISAAGIAERERFEIIAGRPFRRGLDEVIVGVAAAREFAGLDLGASLDVGNAEWPIVGIFRAGGGIAEGEVWTDAAVLQPAYRRGNSYQAVYARLTSAAAYDDFKDALTTDPRLNVEVMREEDYYSGQSSMLRALITGLGTLVASIMGLGALFGALNTMYTTVSARTREIATLRALGFRSSPVVISVLAESLVLAAAGGLLGGVLAYFAFDGITTATLNWQSFSQMAFAFQVTPGLLLRGILCAMLIGIVGGLFPAIRAARLPIATALRES